MSEVTPSTSTQPLATSQSAAPARLGAAAPAIPAVSPGISAVCSAWDDIDSAVKVEVSLNELFQADGQNQRAKKLLSAIAAGPFNADDVRKHFANGDRATRESVASILNPTTVEDLKALQTTTPTSQTRSDPRWQALDDAVSKVLTTAREARNWRDSDPYGLARSQKLAANESAQQELASAILASRFFFSANEIRDYFSSRSAATTAAVEQALRASGKP